MNMRILKEYDSSILYLCDNCIASRALNETPETVDFKNSSLYRWLNTEFPEKHLSAGERERLLEVTLLTASEAAEFLPEEAQRECLPDETAICEGVRIGGNGCCWWWLKDTGFAGDFYQIVDFSGHICSQGTYQTLQTNGVRPVIRLRK